MSNFSIIAPHSGVGGRTLGRDHWRAICEAGGAVLCKSVNDAGQVMEAAQIARQFPGRKHCIVMRWTNPGAGGSHDVPNYQNEPQAEADAFMARIKWNVDRAPELASYRDLVYLQIGNELRTQIDNDKPNYDFMHPVDWLGIWGKRCAEIANGWGFGACLFGMNAGTPEPEDWQRPGMLQLLEWIDSADLQRDVIIGMNEGMMRNFGDYRTDPIAVFEGLTIGRMTHLRETCERNNLTAPYIAVTEWAWDYRDMASQDKSLVDVDALNMRYLPEGVIGCFLWANHTSGHTGDLKRKALDFVEPLRGYNLTTRFDTEPPPIEPPTQYRKTIHIAPADASIAEMEALVAITYKSNGSMIQSYDDARNLLALPDSAPGSKAILYFDRSRHPATIIDWFAARGVSAEFATPIDPFADVVLWMPFDGEWPITSVFDDPRSYANMKHEGVDWACHYGTPIKPSQPGRVVGVERIVTSYGNNVTIQHEHNGLTHWTRYAHLSAISVRLGDRVTIDTVIGHSGNSGNSTGAHLHYSWQTPGYGLSGYYLPDVRDPMPHLTKRPAATQKRLGLHMSAQGGESHLINAEIAELRAMKADVIKVLSSSSPAYVSALVTAFPDALFVVRVFLDFGGRAISAVQFANDTLSDLQRTLSALGNANAIVEIHNEPNLTAEGLGTSWDDGYEFGYWFNAVAEKYKAAGVVAPMMTPGLSPGDDIAGTRQNARKFHAEMMAVVFDTVDCVGVHAYYINNADVDNALTWTRWLSLNSLGKPLHVTETSQTTHAGEFDSADSYADAIVRYWKNAPVQSVSVFLSSGSGWKNEALVDSAGNSRGIGAAIGARR